MLMMHGLKGLGLKDELFVVEACELRFWGNPGGVGWDIDEVDFANIANKLES